MARGLRVMCDWITVAGVLALLWIGAIAFCVMLGALKAGDTIKRLAHFYPLPFTCLRAWLVLSLW